MEDKDLFAPLKQRDLEGNNGNEERTDSAAEKVKYFNKLDEAIEMICLSISRYLLFYVSRATTPDVVSTTLEGLFSKQDAMRVHQLENELISLSPIHFSNLQEFLTKFKSLLVELISCGKSSTVRIPFLEPRCISWMDQ